MYKNLIVFYLFQIARTVKFLCAISISQYIVSTNWIDDSIKSGYLLGLT